MAIRNATLRTAMANAYKGLVPYAALFTADPGATGTATGEVSGGSPAYARKAWNWGTAASSAVTSSATVFDVPSGANIQYVGSTTSGTAGTADVMDTASVTPQSFSSQGTYSVTGTYTQA